MRCFKALFVLIFLIPAAQAWSFGVYIETKTGFSPAHEGADDTSFYIFPLIYPTFSDPAPTLEQALIDEWANAFQFGPSFDFIGARDDDNDNTTIATLDRVGSALELGLYLGGGFELDNNLGIVAGRIAMRQDILGGHSSYVIEPSLHLVVPIERDWAASLSLISSYVGQDYMDAYFSVDAENATASGLDQFDASAGFKDVGVAFDVTYQFNETWSVGFETSYERLVGSASESPIVQDVGSANQFNFGLTLGYYWDL